MRIITENKIDLKPIWTNLVIVKFIHKQANDSSRLKGIKNILKIFLPPTRYIFAVIFIRNTKTQV